METPIEIVFNQVPLVFGAQLSMIVKVFTFQYFILSSSLFIFFFLFKNYYYYVFFMIAVTCTAVTTSYSNWPTTDAGVTVSLTCAYGYTGTPQRTCNAINNTDASGVWSNITNPCVQVFCQAIDTGAESFPTSLVGMVNGTCDANYYGSPSSNCTQVGTTGVWGTILHPCYREFFFIIFLSLLF